MKYSFSDGSPSYEVAAFCAAFALCLLVASRPAVRRILGGWLASLDAFLWRRGLFRVDDVDAEQRRLDLVRIALGALASWRMARELVLAPAEDPTLVSVQVLSLALSLMIAFGVATPVVAALHMLLLNLIFDNLTSASNVGSQVQAMILLVLVFAPAGRTRSVDALLLRRDDRFGAAWRRLYAPWGHLTAERAALLRWGALLCYAAVSFHSGLLHALDRAWATGYLSGWVLLSDVTNPKFHAIADRLYQLSPFLFVNLSRVATYSLLGWLLLLLPLVLWGGVVRTAAIVYGLLFFSQAAFVMPFQMLGWFEFLLWALLFWDGRLPPLPRWLRRAGDAVVAMSTPARVAVRAWLPHRPGAVAAVTAGPFPRSDRLFHAAMLSLAVLLAAFFMRLPLLRDLPVGSAVAAVSRDALGQAPLVFGIGPLSVLNGNDLRMLRITFETYWTEGDAPISDTRLVNAGTADSLAYAVTKELQLMAYYGEVCGEEVVDSVLATRYARNYRPIGQHGPTYFHTQFFTTDWPTESDFAGYKYAPVVRRPTCLVSVNADTLKLERVQYSTASSEVITRRYNLPFRIHPESVPLLGRFPCREEKDRIAAWFDSEWYGLRHSKLAPLVDGLMEDKVGYTDATCFADVQKILATFPLDSDPRVIDPGADCTADLALAEAYYDRVFDGPLRAWTVGLINRATIAYARGDAETCLLAAIEVRRAYLRSLGAPGSEPMARLPGVAAPSPPFRVRPDTIPLLEQFPCRAEVARTRAWGERLRAAPHGPPAAKVAARLDRPGLEADPIECFVEVEATDRELDLNWHAGNPPPNGAPCAADLALAEAYGGVRGLDGIEGHLRAARLAAASGDDAACILAAADVRRGYLALLDPAYAADGRIEAATRDIGLPFPIFPKGVPLVERFPCRAEAERIAWWYDRPDLVARGDRAPAASAALRRAADGGDPAVCLAAVLEVSSRMDLTWSEDHPPPPGTACAREAQLAATYFDAVFSDRFRSEAKALLEDAQAARKRGDDRACVTATNNIRRVYLAGLGAPASIYELAADPLWVGARPSGDYPGS